MTFYRKTAMLQCLILCASHLNDWENALFQGWRRYIPHYNLYQICSNNLVCINYTLYTNSWFVSHLNIDLNATYDIQGINTQVTRILQSGLWYLNSWNLFQATIHMNGNDWFYLVLQKVQLVNHETVAIPPCAQVWTPFFMLH